MITKAILGVELTDDWQSCEELRDKVAPYADGSIVDNLVDFASAVEGLLKGGHAEAKMGPDFIGRSVPVALRRKRRAAA